MKMFKIILFIALIYSITFANSLQKNKIYTVAFAQDTLQNPFRLKQVRVLEETFSRYPNINFIYTNAKSNAALQVKQIEDFMDQGVDLLMASPYDEDATTSVVSKAYHSGIPVVMVDRTIKGDAYTTYVHPNNEKIATDAAKYLVEKMGYKGTILLLKGTPKADVTRKRTLGFYKVLHKYPNIKVLEYTANYLGRDAIIVLEKVIKEGKHFDAIMSQNDNMLVGARMALRANDIDLASIITVGIDYTSSAQEAIQNGYQNSSFLYALSAKESANVAMRILSGEKVPKEIIIDTIQITKENVDDVQPIF